MSGVRLSPGSPGVERVSRTPGSPRTPARRCLFGPVDHGQLAQELARSQQAQEDEQRAKWNFDFLNHRPLEGPLSWELAGPDVPEFYLRGPHPSPGVAVHSRRETSDEEQENRGRKRNGEPEECSSTNMKKSHRTESEESGDSDSSPSPEQTPRKSVLGT
ncbi:cyclin-dependent kinase inhibitor 1B [Bombina bombina]|uniref:cyclin-dependent kinase inhibitor 1B n=1 Tax=Bombina bombina TaxID=8345 RepID=UPI00235AA143|nr:cyclin-dependent kinase inhibitor 1B [Bombina bombina]XP_053574773.1 cyclin-dependent kinase inhibitor 1B [Bombina bombina]